MKTLLERAKDVVDGVSPLQFDIPAVDGYFKRVNVEAVSMMLPRFSLAFRMKWWRKALAHWKTQLTVEQQNDCLNLMAEKNKVYGNRQIYVMGTLGILIRSIDKLERLRNIDAGATNSLMSAESRHDSVMDLYNYSILAILVMKKEL